MVLDEFTLSRRNALGVIAAAAIPSGILAQLSDQSARDMQTVHMQRIGRYATGEALGGAEIVAFHPPEARLFGVNSGAGQVEVLDLSDPTTPSQDTVLDASDALASTDLAIDTVGGTNSVDVSNTLVAAAIEADPATDNGAVAFYDPASLELVTAVEVGPLPDKVTFSPDGNYVVVANEGEPGESDPAGSVSVVNIADGAENATVTTSTFEQYDGQEAQLRAEGVHIASAGDAPASASTAFEPEYTTVTPDSTTAFVSLQENNAIATIDLASGDITSVDGLGFKDFSLPGNELDTSDVDDISLQSWPIKGMYQPDAIDTYQVGGETFVVTANEGDAKDFEVGILKNLSLDPAGFDLSENAYVDTVEELKQPTHLGNMEVNEAAMREFADTNGDGAYSDIYAIGGRSFSVWHHTSSGLERVFDSGSKFEQVFARKYPGGHQNTVESGPETESVTLGEIGNQTYAFVGQEKGSGITVYDVTSPGGSEYIQMVVNRDYGVTEDDLEAAAEANPDTDSPARAGDFAPEGLDFVPIEDSPTDMPLLCVGFELSGTIGVFEIEPSPE